MEREVKIYLGGDALVTALGHGVDENFSAMAQGQIGLHPIESPCRLAAAGKIDAELLQTSALEHYTPLESLMIRCVQVHKSTLQRMTVSWYLPPQKVMSICWNRI